MRVSTETTLYTGERRCFYAAIALLISVFFSYIYFLSASVVHVVMRKEVDASIAELSTSVSELEAEYIEAQHRVSQDIASMQGYVLADEKIFIDRGEDTLVMRAN